MGIKFSNLATTTLASGITNSATTITVADGSVFPALGSGDFFFASIDTPPNSPEVIKVTAISSNTLTVVRGQDGTTATTHASGETIALRVVAAALDHLRDNAESTVVAGTNLSFSGDTLNLDTSTDIAFGDNDKAIFGSATDLAIYSDGTNAYIQEGAGTSGIRITTDNQLLIRKHDTENIAAFNVDGAVRFYHDNSQVFSTTSYGVDITGRLVTTSHIDAPDNAKIRLGDGDDLQIYHDGNNKIEASSGYLRLAATTASTYLDGNNVHIRSGDGGETLARFNDDSDVKLYYDNSQKLATTSTGIDVTGTVTADSAGIGTSSPAATLDVVRTGAGIQDTLQLRNAQTLAAGVGSSLGFGDSGGARLAYIAGAATGANNDNGYLSFYTRASDSLAERLRIDSSGQVGIGTSSPSGLMSFAKGSRTLDLKLEDTAATGDVGVQLRAGSGDYFGIAAGGGTGVGIVIDDSNNVGIGTNSPATRLHSVGAEGEVARIGSGSVAFSLGVGHTGNGTGYINLFPTSSPSTSPTSLAFQMGGTERMRIDSSGRVGIGTSSPTEKLFLKSSSGDVRMLLDAPTGSDAEIKFSNNGTIEYTIGHDDATDNFVIGTANVDTPKVSFTKAGSVGIGTSSITSGRLQVMGGTSGLDQISLSSNVTNNTTKYAGIVMTNYGNTTTALLGGKAENGTTSVYYGSSGSDHRGPQNHIFYTNASATATSGNTERLRITSGGDVIAKTADARIGSDAGSVEYGTSAANSVRFYTNNLERFRLTTSGNVKIGTGTDRSSYLTASTANLQIDGGVVFEPGSGNNAEIFNYRTTAMLFGNGGSEDMRIDSNGRAGFGTTNIDGQVTAYGNSDTVPAISITSDGNHGMHILHRGTDGDFSFERETAGTKNEFMRVDRSSGNVSFNESVGIGTSSPEKRLHIFDGTQTNQTIRFGNPSATARADINYSSVGVEHLYISVKGTTTGYGNIVFSTGSTPDEAARIDSSGRLLVGQTSADNNENGVRLSKVGTSWFTATSDYPMGLNRKTSDGNILWLGKDASNVGSIASYSSTIQFGQGNANLKFSNSSDTITPANGNGTNNNDAIDLGSSSARFKNLWLSDSRSVYFGDTNHYIKGGDSLSGGDIKIRSSDDLLLYSRWARYFDDVGSAGEYARIGFNGSWINSNLSVNGNIKIGAYGGGTTVIDSSRNLTNIGTLNGGTAWRSNNDGSGSGLDADTLDGLQTKSGSSSTSGAQILRSHTNGYLYHGNWIEVGVAGLHSATNNAHIRPNTSGSYATWRITGARGGYAGFRLDDGGGVSIMFDSSGNGGFYRETGGGWYQYYHRSNGSMGIGTSTTSSSYRLYVNGAIYATSNITAYSDARIKENIVTLDSALDKVNALRGVYYNKIDDPEKTKQIGFIAQEVNEVVPELVTYAEDVDQYGVNYGNATALLVEAVKDLTQQVKDLKAEVEELKRA